MRLLELLGGFARSPMAHRERWTAWQAWLSLEHSDSAQFNCTVRRRASVRARKAIVVAITGARAPSGLNDERLGSAEDASHMHLG